MGEGLGLRVRVRVRVALLHPASEAARECRAAQPAERAAHEAVRARAAEHHLTKARLKRVSSRTRPFRGLLLVWGSSSVWLTRALAYT